MKCVGIVAALCVGAFSAAQDGAIGGLVLAPKKLFQGNRVAVCVTTLALETQAPVAAPIAVRLLDGTGKVAAVLHDGATGADGLAYIPFTVPVDLEGAHRIDVLAGTAAFGADVTIARGPAVLIETDKPMYKPGQTIQGRVLLVNNELAPAAGDVELVISDGKGIRIDRRTLAVNAFGAAAFALPLAGELNLGVWKLAARAGERTTELSVQVDKYVLPQFSVGVDLPRDWFLPDEAIEGTIASAYYFGKKVQGSAVVTAQRYVGVWEEYAVVAADIADGEGRFTLPPVGFAAGTYESGGDSAVTIEFAVTDTAGHTEKVTRILKIASAPVEVRLIACEKTLKPGMPLSLVVITETPSGIPQDRTVALTASFQDLTGTVVDAAQEIATSGGEAVATFEAPATAASATVRAVLKEDEHTSESAVTLFAGYSPTASFLHLSRSNDGDVRIGDTVAVTALSTNAGTIFWEVIAAGRVAGQGATRERTIEFTATPDMLPAAEVVAYILNPGNEIACDSLRIPVALQSQLVLDAAFSAAEARPGDTVTLAINAHRKALVGVSVVDSSLLALAGERATLRGIFDILEEQFMAPRAEVHIDDPWEPVTLPGAMDVFTSAGLAVGCSPEITIPAGTEAPSWLRWGGIGFEDWEGGVPELPPAAGGDPSNGLAEVQRVRQFFPETWVWQPLLLTDDEGLATLTLTCPDSITTWHLRGLASSMEGIALAETDITVFQEFFVEPDLPVEVVRGETFPLRLQIYNYAQAAQRIYIELARDDWFELAGESTAGVDVGPGEVTSCTMPITPARAGRFTLAVTARGPLYADAVTREISVVPEGVPFTVVVNGQVSPDAPAVLDLSIPPGAVPDSGRIVVAVTPSLVAQSIGGLDDLLGMPYGCGEQNMIFLAPDVEVLRYLLSSGEAQPEIWAKAEHYINVGYQRQLTYRRADGSFSAFGEQDDQGSLFLTAFVLSTFAGARDVRDVDDTVLAQAALWLAAHQEASGAWKPFGFLHHQELLGGGMGGEYALTAYTAKALAEYNPQLNATALAAARAYLAANRAAVAGDAYALAMAACALSIMPDAAADTEATLDLLMPLARTGDPGIYWEPYPVETTAYAALALINAERPEAAYAIEFITSRRNAQGGFGSTQDTVVAFRALARAALYAQESVDATIDLFAGDTVARTFTVNRSNYDILQAAELPGGGEGRLVMTGTGKVGYQVATRFNLPGEAVPPPSAMLIDVEYLAEHAAVDDVVDVRVRLLYPGPRERTNMVIADVGVPTGFQVVDASLAALLEAGVVARADVAVRKVIFYIRELVAGRELAFTFQARALFPIRAAAVPSKAYDYYAPEDSGIDPGTPITIGAALFVRGDANRDLILDIADAIAMLAHLFAGGPSTCADAMDSNDDGRLNIADPIYLLSYLFASGSPPPPPQGAPGDDPTADGLGCAE
ncbi:MAG TPA: alpha-2-macroglobulin [Planctomycetes bacterium]|nr:alpha-2-macroglobulin [Planctomycetota bacterium]